LNFHEFFGPKNPYTELNFRSKLALASLDNPHQNGYSASIKHANGGLGVWNRKSDSDLRLGAGLGGRVNFPVTAKNLAVKSRSGKSC
jgi:hypothetical protein